jgi:hypothetical protein
MLRPGNAVLARPRIDGNGTQLNDVAFGSAERSASKFTNQTKTKLVGLWIVSNELVSGSSASSMKSKLKSRARTIVGYGPEPPAVTFNDGTTDR